MEQPVERHKLILSPIWLLPLVALCIGGWLLYTSFRDAGIDITVHFADAKGVTPGKTKVIFKGIPIGTVKDIEIDENMTGVDLLIEMENRARPLLVEDTTFWVVKPEVSAGRVSGLETLFGGSYIGTRKGASTEPAYRFKGLDSPPPMDATIPGLRFTLESDTLYSLQRGSHIYSKNLQIGYIEDYTLQENGKILFNAYVKPEFSRLVKTGTRFWNASGLSLTGDLRQGLSVNIGSLASLIYGGITCDTHPSLKDTPQAQPDTRFTLYKDFEAAEYGIPMTLTLNSGEGIVPGKTQVLFRGLKMGVVKQLDGNNHTFRTVTATILLDPRAECILRDSTKFWLVKPEVKLSGVENIGTVLGGNYITFVIGEGEYRDHFIEEPGSMPKEITRPGTYFTLTSKESGSLDVGAPVLYKQMQVGEVSNISLRPEQEDVALDIIVYHPHDQLVKADSVFWNSSGVQVNGSISNLKVNLASLQTVFTGGVAFTTPENKEKKTVAEEGAMFPLYEDFSAAVEANRKLQPDGLIVRLKAENLPPLAVGSPVLFNNINVGKILSLKPAANGKGVNIEGLVNREYKNLVNTSSRFYRLSGLNVKASLQGIELQTGTLDSILSGGIAFINGDTGNPVPAGHRFTLHESYNTAFHADDLRLSLTFHHGTGISTNTKIKYQGIEIGRIESIGLSEDTTRVVGTAYVMPNAARLFRTDTRLMLIRPEISLSGIKNLGTVLSGTYIEVKGGQGKQRTAYTVQEYASNGQTPLSGLNIILEASRLGSLSKGSPVYYRQIQVGQVTGYSLSPSNQRVWINVNIDEVHRNLIYSGTRFWNTSGFTMSGSVLSGLNVTTESLKALVQGGVSLATPEGEDMGTEIGEGAHFPLEETSEPEWLEWSPVLPPSATGSPLPSSTSGRVEGREDRINE